MSISFNIEYFWYYPSKTNVSTANSIIAIMATIINHQTPKKIPYIINQTVQGATVINQPRIFIKVSILSSPILYTKIPPIKMAIVKTSPNHSQNLKWLTDDVHPERQRTETIQNVDNANFFIILFL